MWLKVWFSTLEKAESENGEIFEVTEEEMESSELDVSDHSEPSMSSAMGSISVLSSENSKCIGHTYSYKEPLIQGTSLTKEKLAAFEMAPCSSTNTKANWLAYHDSHEIHQQKWSNTSSSSSRFSSATMSTTSSTES